jgi:REP element-mobilizing transposase RayT
MARPLRLEFPGAVYHVISRGNEKSPIFREDRDRRTFLAILASVIRKESWRLHSFCLLDNHYHLLIETPLGKLSRGMHALNSRYSQAFNRRHDRCGHLFEGRFKGILVEKERHLLELHRYIVLNPVRAGLSDSPEDWTWSSYRATCGLVAVPPWLEIRWTLAQFGGDRETAVSSYVRFVLSGMAKSSPPTVSRQIFVGGETFVSAMARRLAPRVLDDDIPRLQRQPCPPTLEDVCAAVAWNWRIPVEALGQRRAGEPRLAAIYLATKLTGLTARKVGAAFGIRRGRVSNVISEVEKGGCERLRRRLQLLEDFLKTEQGHHSEILLPPGV